MRYLMVTHLTSQGYVQEVVYVQNLRVVVKGGFHSLLTGSDGDLVEVRRTYFADGKLGAAWFQVSADSIGEMKGFDAEDVRPVRDVD